MIFLDTSAILNQAYLKYNNIWIIPTVLKELENIKTNFNKDETIKYFARQAIKYIISSDNCSYFIPNERKIKEIIKKYKLLENNNDHRILAEVILLQKENKQPITFITGDGSLYLFAKTFSQIAVEYYISYENRQNNYYGWKDCSPSDLQLISLYSHPEINILNCKNNEFVKIYENQQLKDILFWSGEKYENLKYKEFHNVYSNEIIKPRNIEQKMLFHLLQNQNIKVKVATGHFGTGKTMLMLQHAIKGVKEGRFSKIIYVRNNIITKGSRDIGYLSGSLVEKIKPYLMPIADLTSEEYLDELIISNTLEPVPLGFMRGRDFSSSVLVFVDEAENLTKENVQLLIGRVGESSEIWFAGDLHQIDHKDFEKNNGLNKMIQSLAGNELFGMVKLMKAERSRTSQLADLMD